MTVMSCAHSISEIVSNSEVIQASDTFVTSLMKCEAVADVDGFFLMNECGSASFHGNEASLYMISGGGMCVFVLCGSNGGRCEPRVPVELDGPVTYAEEPVCDWWVACETFGGVVGGMCLLDVLKIREIPR